MTAPAADDERAWAAWRRQWALPDDVVYLNHGSFGPTPRGVQAERQRWSERCASQPMDFFVRQYDALLCAARERLGRFVGAPADALLWVDNATVAMNVVAASVRLAPGDEVLLTDHEYGAVERIWRRACDAQGAKLVVAPVATPAESAERVVDEIFAAAGPRTRLLVVSHVTSPTAIVFPIERICRQARQRGIAVCVDGPHAVAMCPLEIERLDCEYYAASCHKWLSAPFGSGFLYVAPRAQGAARPTHLSWGRPALDAAPSWRDEFDWVGTRDVSALLAIGAAIELVESLPPEALRRRGHALAQYSRARIIEAFGTAALTPDSPDWYGMMVAVALPPGEAAPLQRALWERWRIEVPIVAWQGRRLLRVSCHAYTQRSEIDRLVDALRELIAEGA